MSEKVTSYCPVCGCALGSYWWEMVCPGHYVRMKTLEELEEDE